MPVIPATQEAEAGELLEPRRERLESQDCVIALQPGQQEWNSVSKNKLINLIKLMGFFLKEFINIFNIPPIYFEVFGSWALSFYP